MNKRFLRILTAVIMLVSVFFVTAVCAQAAEVKDVNGIITQPADGTMIWYERPGIPRLMMCPSGSNSISLYYQSEYATNMIKCEDGTLYWQDPLCGFISNNWIKGKIENDKITFDNNQPLVYDSKTERKLTYRWGSFNPESGFSAVTTGANEFVFKFDEASGSYKLNGTMPVKNFATQFNFPGLFWGDTNLFAGYGDCEVELIPLTSHNIINNTPESEKGQNHGYIDIYPTAPEDYYVYLDLVPALGYGVESVTYNTKGGTPTEVIPYYGVYEFQMPKEDVMVEATFKELPPTFVSVDRDEPFSDKREFYKYKEGRTKWKDYTFAGWFYYNEEGIETKLTKSYDEAPGVTYTAKWKNSAGKYVITEGVTVEPDCVYIGDSAFYESNAPAEKVENFRVDAGIYAGAEGATPGSSPTSAKSKSNNFILNVSEKIVAGKLAANGKAVSKYDPNRFKSERGEKAFKGSLMDGIITDGTASANETSLKDYGISFTPAHDGQRATLKLENASIEARDGTCTYYYVEEYKGETPYMYYIYAGLFSEIPLDLKLAGKNTIRIELEDEDSCAFGIFNPSGALNITGKNLTVDAGSTDCYRSGGIILESNLENSANVTAIAGKAADSSYGVNCNSLNNTGGVLKGVAGSGVYSNGINAVTAENHISGGTVIGVGGTGSKEYYGLWTGENIKVTGNGVLALKGGKNADSSIREALYLEGENSTITIEDKGKIIADSAVKNLGKYADRYLVTGAQTGITSSERANTVLYPTGSEAIVISVMPTNHIHHGGSSVDETSYDIGISSDIKNGSIKISPEKASAGQTVTLTVKPDTGFNLETIAVTDKDGVNLELNKIDKNTFSFIMPESNVKVSADFAENNTILNYCVDVKAGDYFYDAVLWAYQNGICKGVSDTHFGPNYPVTRAQVVTFLWRAAGCPVVNYAMNMKDVPAGEYYSEAVRWALSKGITNGTSASEFSPEAVCTRGQIVTFLARFAGVKDAETDTVFTDVKASDYYAAAVKWAKENGVTEGTSATKFSPADDCTRGQVVTFLYRWIVK